MKRIITTTILAVLLSVISLSAQEAKVTYIIDGKKIENFDGSQLTGKTITSYTISDNVHVVFTSDYNGQTPVSVKVIGSKQQANGFTVSERSEIISVNGNAIVYVIDGKVTSSENFKSMSTSNIESVRVIKSKDDPDFKKYAKSSTYIVMMITTKK